MRMATDPVASLPSGMIDRLLRAAVAAPGEVSDEPVGRFMARMLVELADRDEEVLLNTYLAAHPSHPPRFTVRVSRPGESRPDEMLEGLHAARALRAASSRTGLDDTVVEVIAREPGMADRVVFRADPGEDLTFLVPVGEPADGDIWAKRLKSWATSLEGGTAAVGARNGDPEVRPLFDRSELAAAVRQAVADMAVHLDVDELVPVIASAIGEALAAHNELKPVPPPSAREIASAVGAVVPAASSIAAELRNLVRAELREAMGEMAEPQPVVPSAGELAAAVVERLPSGPVVPSAGELAAAVVERLPSGPVVPSAEDIAERVRRLLPPPPSVAELARAVAAAIPEPPSIDAVVDRLGQVGFEIDAEALAGALGPLAPSAAAVADAVLPELERAWVRIEQQVATRLFQIPSSADIDSLRADARELRDLLRSSRLSFVALNEEIVGSARRSREQIEGFTEQLSDELQRWARRVEERLDKMLRDTSGGDDVAEMRRLLADLEGVARRLASLVPSGTPAGGVIPPA